MSAKVRNKDLAMVHAGPIHSFPIAQHSKEVYEALDLLKEENPEGVPIVSWNEFAELAWSKVEAKHIVIAWHMLLENPAIEMLDNGFRIRSKEEQQKLIERKGKKRKSPKPEQLSLRRSGLRGKRTIHPLLRKTRISSLLSMN